MSIEGRINVDALFHDKDGTASLKVVSLQDSKAYTTGKVAIVTGTVGTSQIGLNTYAPAYRDSSGSLVTFSTLSRVVFSYSGSTAKKLLDIDGNFLLSSRNNEPAASSVSGNVDAVIDPGSGTGTYTIILYGT
jgi:hypothetical protein